MLPNHVLITNTIRKNSDNFFSSGKLYNTIPMLYLQSKIKIKKKYKKNLKVIRIPAIIFLI